MKTEKFRPDQVAEGAAVLRRGGLLGIPTETVYGLGANGLDPEAVARIFAAKGRPQDNPLILHVPSADWLERYCADVPGVAYTLAGRFWPGPLTMILEDKGVVSALVNDEGDTLGVRCPDHPMTQSILQEAGVALAAPSANPSDLPSPKTAQEVLDYFDGHIEGIVDGGPCAMGVESTIVDLTGDEPVILREGGIPAQELLDFIREHQA